MISAKKDIKVQLEKWLEYAQNKIRRLVRSNGELVQAKQGIEEEVIGFYRQLLGSTTEGLPAINPTVMRGGPLVNREQQLKLVLAITREEVYTMPLKILSDNKAPGCDGFNALFFKRAWLVTDTKVTDTLLEFFSNANMYQSINCTTFSGKFVQWTMRCVTTVSYSIIINSQPKAPFPAKKGLIQGDQLSLYLFVLAMEYLTRLLIKTLKRNPNFNYHPKCATMNIVQLSFADDLLLFCRGDTISVQLLYELLGILQSLRSSCKC
ncbi:PREDICTED: uncharacterized protein LOC109235968 [Nicotiana attenuata]|uniref:uncharacterized protein LOC109235968 n=1 Tax=Nicotiana attenuata TaxID=49451 RepID=UPI000905B8C3|nr:PREDICTED: uncharacterized protein LOC109235968 [Nicotiana attenuata]